MIVSCPQCVTRFVLPSTVFENGGRKMKCASCGHVWFQEEPLERADDNANIQDHKDVEQFVIDEDSQIIDVIKADVIEGKIVVAIGLIVTLVLFFLYHSMNASLIMGQGLAFNQLSIERQEPNFILIKGEIVNAMNEKRGIPNLEVTQLLEDGHKGDTKVITPDKKILEAGEALSIAIQIDDIDPHIRDIHVGFEGAGQEKSKMAKDKKKNEHKSDDADHDH